MSEAVQTFIFQPVFSPRNLNCCLQGISQAARILGCSEVLTIAYANIHSSVHLRTLSCPVPSSLPPSNGVSLCSNSTKRTQILHWNREGPVLGCWGQAGSWGAEDSYRLVVSPPVWPLPRHTFKPWEIPAATTSACFLPVSLHPLVSAFLVLPQ